MKAYKGRRSIAALILNPDAGLSEWQISRPDHFTTGKKRRLPLISKLDGPQSRSGRLEKTKMSCSHRNSSPGPSSTQPSRYAALASSGFQTTKTETIKYSSDTKLFYTIPYYDHMFRRVCTILYTLQQPCCCRVYKIVQSEDGKMWLQDHTVRSESKHVAACRTQGSHIDFTKITLSLPFGV